MTDHSAVRTSDFDYDLPKHMIAQAPLEPRDASRLLVLHRRDGRIEHRVFRRDRGVFAQRRSAGTQSNAGHPGSPLWAETDGRSG